MMIMMIKTFFGEVLQELPLLTQLTTVRDGEQLLQLLSKLVPLPAVIFLDLNMPRKNGIECLTEIKMNDELKKLPVIIYSTSFEPAVVDQLYNKGAKYYIPKPTEFYKIKQVIYRGIMLAINSIGPQPEKENFVLQP